MKKLLFVLIFVPLSVFSQNCSCEDDFKWLKNTIEENDAGFQYVIDIKGQSSYDKHNEDFTKKVKSISKQNECTDVLKQWLLFFRSGHLSLNTVQNIAEQDKQQVINTYKNWEKYAISDADLKKYMSKLKQPAGLEGIWRSDPYTIAIVKKDNQYIGFVVQGDELYWQKNQIKLRLKPAVNGEGYEGVYYMKDHSEQRITKTKLVGNNYMTLNWLNFKRISPQFTDSKLIADYVDLITSPVPVAKQISDKTFLLRIPSFSETKKRSIDSLIAQYHDKIASTDNLIIDIRNNGGGSDGSFQKLLPFIYTNPLRSIGVSYLSTPLNNKRMEDFMVSKDFSASDKEWARNGLKKLNANIGKFVNLQDSDSVEVSTMDSIYVYPKKVAILVNENNGSTAEQFLLTAKQSAKVKLFGTTTAGVLDISNMYFVESPCKTMRLGYSLSKSRRIPDMAIDNKGIQPDYYIDSSIPDQEWINFTEQTLLGK